MSSNKRRSFVIIEPTPIYCDVARVTNQSIPHNIWTKVQYNSPVRSRNLVFDFTNFQYLIQQDGIYLVSAIVNFAGVAGNSNRGIRIMYNLVEYARIVTPNTSTGSGVTCAVGISKPLALASSSILHIEVIQQSGAALNIVAPSGAISPINFSVDRISVL